MQNNLLIAGGIMNLLGAVFHILFWKIFKWTDLLPKMGRINSAILQMLNLVLIYVFLSFSAISFYLAYGIPDYRILKIFCWHVSGLFIFRAILQIPYLGWKTLPDMGVITICLILAGIYLGAVWVVPT